MNSTGHSCKDGFTLFELLVVLTIMSLAMAIVVPGVSSSISGSEVKSAARQVVSSMRLARNQAIKHRQAVAFYIDVERRYYKTGQAGKKYQLPEQASISLYTARSQLQDDGSGYIRFFSDGSASGGRVTLSSDQVSHLIDVNWLTGGVSIKSVDPVADI